jgi:hypothetical protein
MRLGADGEDEMLALFTDDVFYSDPFGTGGEAEGVVGLAAVRDRLRAGWEFRPPDLELTVHTVAIDGDSATSTWECRSTVFDHPMSGRDEYTFRDGKIAELRVRLTQDRAGS